MCARAVGTLAKVIGSDTCLACACVWFCVCLCLHVGTGLQMPGCICAHESTCHKNYEGGAWSCGHIDLNQRCIDLGEGGGGTEVNCTLTIHVTHVKMDMRHVGDGRLDGGSTAKCSRGGGCRRKRRYNRETISQRPRPSTHHWAPVPLHARALCAPWRRSRLPVPATARVTAASVLRADDGCFSGHLAAANVAWAIDGA